MYSEKVISKRLEAIERKYGVAPVYHSLDACDEAVAHFNDKMLRHVTDFGEDASDSLEFDEEEIRWIQNEQRICAADYMYYATRYAYILVNNKVIHYKPQLSQLIANDIRADLEDRGWAIMQMFLKARQVGVTTDSQIAISHRTFFYPNTVALTGSCEKDKSQIMLTKYRLLYDMLPYWLKPDISRDRAGSFMIFGGLNSQLVVQHGRQMSGIGRGNTPTVVHLSELASFEDPENLVEAGLMPAIHEDQSTLFILESTAEGPFGWWYKKWGLSKSGFWEGRAKLCPVFLPWFTRPDIYPTPTWLRQHSKGMATWIPLPVTIAHAERARNNIRASEYLRKRFAENWQMTREQMYFWEISREEARQQGILDVFQREFCADDLEAFTASGHSVFDVDTISSYNEHTEEPKIVFGFRAADHVIPPRLQIQHTEVDASRKPIDMGRYQLVPSKWNGWDITNVEGKLLIFEWPEDNEEYGLGVDTADGIGQDRSVVQVLRKGSITRNDGQAAEYASPYINAMDLAPICHAIGLLYQNGGSRQPRMVIEVKGNGELTQLELLKMGWSNFHKWVRYDRKKIDSIKATRLGWFTTSWSRPMLIDKLVKALRDGSIDINSREFVREMATLHRDWDQQDARAEDEAHDDRFMALGFVYFSLHILEFTGRASDISYLRSKREEGNWKYRESSYDEEHELRPDRESGVIVAPYHHPGAIDTSWEEEYV